MSLFYEIHKSDFSVIHNKRELYFKEHMHKYVEILYVFEGVQHITVQDKSYKVDEGSAALIFPNLPHSYYKSEERFADEVIIIFDPAYLSHLFPSIDLVYATNPIISKENINEETKKAMAALAENPPLEIRLAYTIIAFSNLLKQTQTAKRSHIPTQNLTSRIVTYIDANYTEDINRDVLAKEFAVSKYHISHVFNENFKKSLPTYLAEVRCSHAARLIRSSDFKLTAIARVTGFKSIRTFNRAFKEIFGVTPSEYKKSFSK